MENIKGSSNIRNSTYTGKNPLLPPKIPFPCISPSYVDYVSNSIVGPRGLGNPKEVNNTLHQRTSSESVLLEEQPSWLDDLLNEPDTPVHKGGHRRSSSDSFAYIDVSNASTMNHWNLISVPSWGSQDFQRYKDVQHSFYPEPVSNFKSWTVDLSLGRSGRDNTVVQSPGSSSVSQESDGVSSTASQKQDATESDLHDSKSNSELKDPSNANKASASDSDTKRAKQQFAQRSRVRKLQYIAELERSVQALQAEGSEISAELEFINQQNLILNMENKNLKQRLDSLAQEQLIKYLEHEMLEREVGRLRTMCQQFQLQHQQQPLPSSHRRTNSRDLDSQHRRINSKDLDSQFANLSLKQHKDQHKDNGSGPLNI